MRKPAKKMFTTRYRFQDIERLRGYSKKHGIPQAVILEQAIYRYATTAPREPFTAAKVAKYTSRRKTTSNRVLQVVSASFKLAPYARTILDELKDCQCRPIEHIVEDALDLYLGRSFWKLW